MDYKTILDQASDMLTNFKIKNPRLDCELLLSNSLKISDLLRKNGFKVVTDPLRRSMKSQLRDANKLGAKFALILGETEIKDNTITFKDLGKGIQKTILQSEVINFFDDLTN